MPSDNPDKPPVAASSPLRRFLWDGVLPEAMGLCFVAIIFGGFVSAYLIAGRSWTQESATARQADAEAFTKSMAAVLGGLSESDESAADALLRNAAHAPGVRSVHWTTPEGAVRFAWPPTLVAIPSAGATDPEASSVATAAVTTPTGQQVGTLRIERGRSGSSGFRSALLWNWGIAAGITLFVFAIVYHRLRKHLSPVAAIERSLDSYASGTERELATLMLSDSLGGVARSWNSLIEQLTDMQRQVEGTEAVGQSGDVMARFEGAIFRNLVDHLPLGVLRVGERDVLSYANAAAGGLLGHEPDAMVGQELSKIVPEPAVLQALAGGRARSGADVRVDIVRGTDDQETMLRLHLLQAAGLPSGEVLVTVEDVSQLREGQRTRDNFLYHVTHELRTPLTNISAYAETLTKPGFDDEQTRKECYNVIISETRRLSSLVENILSISQLEVGSARLDMGPVDLVRLLRQMVQDNLGLADEKHIDLTLALPPKAPKITGDKQRLSVLLSNLIGNAVKYTPRDGKVHVRFELDPHCARVLVTDTGIGISQEDQAHVFDKFYRAAHDAVQEVSGTGLGLALAREVARLHGGDIELESELDKGSTFTIELPLPTSDHAEVSAR